jgi:hypothetical protein
LVGPPHAGKFEGDNPDEKRYPGPSRWGLGRKTNNATSVKKTDVQNTSEMLRKGLINRRRSGYKEKDLTFGIPNVRKLFKTGALISLLLQLKKYLKGSKKEKFLNGKCHNKKQVGKPGLRRKDVVLRDTTQILE